MANEIKSILILSLLTLCVTHVACQREARRIADMYKDFKSPCGTADKLTAQTGTCMKEVIDLVEGRFQEPKVDADLVGHCGRFSGAERCTRQLSKDCLSGIHKTVVGSVSSATKRWRTRECKSIESRARYMEPLKCVHRKGAELENVFHNLTGIMQGVRDLPIAPEEKLIKMCCALNLLDRELETRLNRDCPKQTATVIAIVHAMTDDARNTLCVSPKCSGALDRVINNKFKPPQNFIEPIVQILFQLNVS